LISNKKLIKIFRTYLDRYKSNKIKFKINKYIYKINNQSNKKFIQGMIIFKIYKANSK